MEIAFVASEVAPFGITSAAGALTSALAKALRGIGHKVTLISPLYGAVDPAKHSLARRLSTYDVDVEGTTYKVELYEGRTVAGTDVMFLGHELFRSASHLTDGADDATLALRAGVFCRAVELLLRSRAPAFQLVHGHDWLGALAVHGWAHDAEPRAATALSLHQLEGQPRFATGLASRLGLSQEAVTRCERGGQLEVLALGLLAANRIILDAPAIARAVVAPGGHPLGSLFADMMEKTVGVCPGLDTSVWNPATDPKLSHRFDPMDVIARDRCKTWFQNHVGLPVRLDAPLLTMYASDADEVATLERFLEIAPEFLRNDAQAGVVLAGAAEPALKERCEAIRERFGDRFAVTVAPDEALLHQVLAAGDLFLVPTGAGNTPFRAMQAQRYGALPVAQRDVLVEDLLVDADAHLETGSAILHDTATPEDLLAALRRGVAAFQSADAFEALRRRTMRLDRSWDRAARLVAGGHATTS